MLSALSLSLAIITDDMTDHVVLRVDEHLRQPRAEQGSNTSIGAMIHIVITSITENLWHETGDE